MLTKRPAKKDRFTPEQRVFEGAACGIAPFVNRVPQAEKRLIARALASTTAGGVFADAVWRLWGRKDAVPDRRLLDRFLSFSEAERARHANLLSVFYDDPRARKELLRLARKASGAKFWLFALTLGRAGGLGARALLRKRLREFAEAVARSRRKRLHQDFVEVYATTAGGLLLLDRDSLLAARTLVAIYADRGRYGDHTNAVAYMREAVLALPVLTRAMVLIRTTLRTLLEPDSDEEDFATALPSMHLVDSRRTLERAKAVLSSTSEIVRMMAAQELSLRPPIPSELLLTYLTHHADDSGVISVARRLGADVPDGLRCAMVEWQLENRYAHSRLEAAQYLSATPGPRAKAIAMRSLRSEPEPVVAHILRERASAR